MRRLHIALTVKDLNTAIEDYSRRLNAEPVSVANNAYALWRTREVNLSISQNPEAAGRVRHLGFEDPQAPEMTMDYDADGFMWEHFSAEQQREEIFRYYPEASYPEDNL